MKFWKRWIFDIRGKTLNCSLAQRGAYDALLDEYYASEAPLPSEPEALYRICGALSKPEQVAVDSVVKMFFSVADDGMLHNSRADQYLIEEMGRSENQTRRGKLGAAARWSKPDAHGEIKPKRVNGHSAAPLVFPEWLDAEQFNRWIKIRPAKARTPDAQQAAIGKLEKLRAAGHDVNAIVSESLANGWQGLFKPDVSNGKQEQAITSPSLQRKPCAYCGAQSIGRVNQIDHCRAHSDAATFHEPIPTNASAKA